MSEWIEGVLLERKKTQMSADPLAGWQQLRERELFPHFFYSSPDISRLDEPEEEEENVACVAEATPERKKEGKR